MRLWWHPPGPRPLYSQPPSSPDAFYHARLFLWVPYRLWAYRLLCSQPNCRRLGFPMTACGMYKTVRKVLDVSGWYYMATEYLECRSCKKKLAAWSQDILSQLDPVHREMFPAVLTYRLSCDKEVVRWMRGRSLGNSATSAYRSLCVRHREKWIAQTTHYLSVVGKFPDCTTDPSSLAARLPQMVPVPCPAWLLSVYAKDVLTRLPELKARVTSIYGTILKMDSTKKVTKKLAGEAAGTAAWVTDVGNEFGQVLMCVLTEAEGDGLLPMCSGLVERYRRAGEVPPQLLYVDRDCCSATGKGKAAAMFTEWDQLIVRLDIWHFMRRFAVGVTTDSHPLYASFMKRLTACIFEWDASDVEKLMEAKRSTGSQPTAKELAKHCRRRTRGAQETMQLIEKLLQDFMGATDTMGIRLLDQERMQEIWQTQQRHVQCIQDPPGVQLYRKTGQVTKEGVILPVYRCARGSTSLESFHLHLNRFVPGTSANALHFQMYLLEGLVQWNEARGVAAVEGARREDICYGGQLLQYCNVLSQQLLGQKLVQDYTSPGEYTGELIGVGYLYSQTNRALEEDIAKDPDVPDGLQDEDLLADLEGDEGFEDAYLDEPTEFMELESNLQNPSQPPSQTDPAAVSSSPALSSQSQMDSVGPNGQPGYDHVIRLADCLVDLRLQGFVTQSMVDEIVMLWNHLADHDKGPLIYSPRHRDRLLKGRFKVSHSKTNVTPGTDSLKRCFLGEGGPAQWPSTSRLVEAICLALCRIHPAGQTIAGVRVNRWAAILRDYRKIRDVVLGSPGIMAQTKLKLFELNQLTISQWFNARTKEQEREVLQQDIEAFSAPLVAPVPLPPVLQKLPEAVQHGHSCFESAIPQDASGQAAPRPRGRPPSVGTTEASVRSGLHVSPGTAHSATYLTPVSTSAPFAALTFTTALEPSSAGFAVTVPAGAAPVPVSAGAAPVPAPVGAAPVPAPVGAAPVPAPAGAAPVPVFGVYVPVAAPDEKRVPKTTAWRRKKLAEAAAAAAAQGLTPRKRQAPQQFLCQKCGQPKTKEFGHSQFRGVHFCAKASGKTVAQWMEEVKRGETK
ncbi:uncharacterized protein LOC130241304 isoform X1 [Danio aesculapii]|uniref:uncharacterized protein LOC130241304 isoform X1 n=1 Tax=Danio aesculapii TaxID=1142201 RepID=UPI0024C0926A|nr:uncharacterized protein LOC130241304 isoform X1 [Danio aesculapii]